MYRLNNPNGERFMKGIEALVVGGALFKKKKPAAPPQGEDARAREAAIRKKVVDDYRGREDAIRDKEAELAGREEELRRSQAELALRLQEAAVAGSGPGGPYAGQAGAGAGTFFVKHALTVEEQERLIRRMELELAKARARFDEMVAQERMKTEYIATLNEYRTRGYVVARLEAAMGKGIEEVQKAFELYAADLARLAAMAEKCDAMDPVFAPEAAALKARCNDPDAIRVVEKGLAELGARVEAKRRLLMDRVGKWRAEGYVTSRFDSLQGAPLGALEEAVIRFDDDLGVLRMFHEKLNGLDKALALEAAGLRKRLFDPDRIPELEREVLALQQRAGSQKQELSGLLQGWKAEGYRTDSVEKALDGDLPAMQAAFFRFEEDVRRLRSLGERLARIDPSFGQQTAVIVPHLKDPALIQDIEEEIAGLELEQERQVTDLRKLVEDLRAKGYSVVRLEEAMAGGLEAARKGLADFETDLKRLNGLAPRVAALAETGRFPSETAELEKLLKEPDRRTTLEKALLGLEERSRKEQERPGKEKPKKVPKEKVADNEDEAASTAPGDASAATAAQAVTAPDKVEAPAAAPATDGAEKELEEQLQRSENMIKELDDARIDATAAANLLKLARSFVRSRNFAKALTYARKAYDTAAAMKK